MNRLLSLLAMLMGICSWAYALAPQVATLSHEGEIKTFYGVSALQEAVRYASDGDIITLSPGMFGNIDENDKMGINKSITIYGAGYEKDSICGEFPTIVHGLSIGEFENKDLPPVVVEGVYIASIGIGDNAKAQIRNCRVYGNYMGTGEGSESQLINCIGGLNFGRGTHYCLNSILDVNLCVQGKGEAYFDHCVLYGHAHSLRNGYIKNSFVIIDGWVLENTNQFENTVVFNGVESVADIDSNFNVKILEPSQISDVFEDFSQDNDSSRFHLKESAKQEYTVDGDEIGIHGGYYPWNYELSIPQISTFEVDPESTAEGKLNIKVVVKNK